METNSINSFLVLITGDIDNFMYTYILVALLVFTGIYFTIRTKGVQFRYIKGKYSIFHILYSGVLSEGLQVVLTSVFVLYLKYGLS